jgi:hypothetical protein
MKKVILTLSLFAAIFSAQALESSPEIKEVRRLISKAHRMVDSNEQDIKAMSRVYSGFISALSDPYYNGPLEEAALEAITRLGEHCEDVAERKHGYRLCIEQ